MLNTRICRCLALPSLRLRSQLDAGKVLRKKDVDGSRAVFDAAIRAAREFAENQRKQHDERDKAENHQRQFVVENQHRRQHAEHHKHILDQVYDDVGEHLRNRLRVTNVPTGMPFSCPCDSPSMCRNRLSRRSERMR